MASLGVDQVSNVGVMAHAQGLMLITHTYHSESKFQPIMPIR
jgi:hypothetical protein